MKITKAIIPAAGMSRRLNPIEKHKALVKIDNITLIDRSIKILKENGITDITIVLGYEADRIRKHLGKNYTYLVNPFYEITNNMASLWFAREYVKNQPFFYSHVDLLYHPQIVTNLIKAPKSNILLAVEKKVCGEEEMKVKVKNKLLIESSKQIPLKESYGEWIGMIRFSKEGGQKMFDACEKMLFKKEYQAYDSLAFSYLVKNKYEIDILDIGDLPWIEIDFPSDYNRAKTEIIKKIKKY